MLGCCCLSAMSMESDASSPIEISASGCPVTTEQNTSMEGPNIDDSGASKGVPPLLSCKGFLPFAQSFCGLKFKQDEVMSPLENSDTEGTGLTTHVPFNSLTNSADFRETQDNVLMPSQTVGVAGVLYKWVNFGKGWRARWFVLQDGVLSYYKVHGPRKITFNNEMHKTFRIIGEKSQRLMKKREKLVQLPKSVGEVHLQISSIRKSKSDDRRFYIHTGTKTLHIRSESKEDRTAWLDALNAVKEGFPQSTSPQHLLPYDKVSFSTEKLRDRLLEEGVPEDVIKDCEMIMKAEFSVLEEYLEALKQRYIDLLERLKQLEAEKLELETALVDESHDRVDGHEQVETETDTDDEQDHHIGVEADTEDEDVYFDTRESLSAESFGHSPSNSRQASAKSIGQSLRSDSVRARSLQENGNFGDSEIARPDYQHVERRKRLPEPKEKERSFSLWSIIKDNIGKDLTSICLPVYFNEPLSTLQRCFEEMEYSYLLDRAYEWGKQGNSLMMILHVAAFAVSGYCSTKGRTCKPFNPLLGETYEADYPDKGLRFFSEKVSHHPVIVACHCEGRNWLFWGDSTLKSRFWGRSIQLDPVGVLTLRFADGQTFQWSKVSTSIYNLILGQLYCDHYGIMHIQGNKDLSCKLKFKEQSIIDRNPHQVQGYVHDRNGNKLATLFGKWDESMYFVPGDFATKPKGYEPMSEAVLLWRCNDPPEFPTRYNLTAFAITLNELTPGLKEKLPPTDSRLRPDQRHLEDGEYELANAEKLRLEKKQRQARKLQERGWKAHWFQKGKNCDTFEYIGGYWEARENGKWDRCPDIFGHSMPVESLNNVLPCLRL
eukprot:c29009_g1_i2 orf=796-3285(-)